MIEGGMGHGGKEIGGEKFIVDSIYCLNSTYSV